ncbi:MAG: NADPH dehydrogenase, partial [Brevinema sp.]
MSLLFLPYHINNLKLKNRIAMAPMCMRKSENGFVSDFHRVHYGACALGEVALIIVEATAITPEGRIMEEDLGIWSDHHIEGLMDLCRTIQKCGARAGIQIAHAGRKSLTTDKPLSVGSIPFNDNYAIPKQLSVEEIQTVVHQFVDGIKRAIQAGFEFIEIHAAHGYLINQFLSSATNHRKDQYGGSL